MGTRPVGRLTIYIESDGAPWRTSDSPPSDPTPLKPLVLRMAADHQALAVAYVGRPCQYLPRSELAACDPDLWLQARFGDQAVSIMDRALNELKADYGARSINLVGYSGGGAMAALLAARRADVVCLVTIAAPLDTGAWTKAIGVSPLRRSLNPADFADKLRSTPQTHFRGAEDQVVPPRAAEPFLNRTPGAKVVDLPGDHECCWAENWQALQRQSCLAEAL